MNILIISDQFKKGGLETHIETYYNYLKKNNKVVFIFGKCDNEKYLKNALIYKDLCKFNETPTIEEFCDDVQKIVDIVKKEKIDVIHTNPFFSMFPAAFAANITNTKIVSTFHGRASSNFYNRINDTILFNFFTNEYINKIFCVNYDNFKWLKNPNNNVEYFPNIIDENIYKENKIILNNKWALISRLDVDKYPEIKKLLLIIKKLNIKVDIYGDGNIKKDLELFIIENNLMDFVKLKGYVNDWYNKMDGKYNGIIGQGRVALEALTMNYPLMLLGYNKIGGLINKNIFNRVKNINFVPADLEDIDLDKLQKDLKKLNDKLDNYQFRKEIINDYGIKKIDKYIEIINKLNSRKINCLDNCYNQIVNIKNKEQLFYNSLEVYNILKFNIGQYTYNPELKTIINLFDKKEYLNLDKNQYDINVFVNNINIKVEKIEKDIELYKKEIAEISIKNVFKKSLNEWILKIKTKWRK